MVMTLQRFGALERVEIPQLDRHVCTARSCKTKNMISQILSRRNYWLRNIFTKHFPVRVKGHILHRVSVALERAFKVTRFEIP